MSKPVVCPAGQICDAVGLRSPSQECPPGHYCLNGTKATSLDEYGSDTSGVGGTSAWSLPDWVTGVRSFFPDAYRDRSSTPLILFLFISYYSLSSPHLITSSHRPPLILPTPPFLPLIISPRFSYVTWPLPAWGKSRQQTHPLVQCDGFSDCAQGPGLGGGSSNVPAEGPLPCPLGYYCRAGVTSQIPIPKNFSTPQRCYDGFFCPRGSISPEGSGACPNGYFCPTQMDAIPCPSGNYCPGVGNIAPIECQPGAYNPYVGRANCTSCPIGMFLP